MKNLLLTATIVLLSTLVAIGCSATKVKEASNTSTQKVHTKKPVQTKTFKKRQRTYITTSKNKAKIIEAKTYQLVKIDATALFIDDATSYHWKNKASNTISKQKSFVQKYNKKGIYEITLNSTNKVFVLVGLDKTDTYKFARVKGLSL